MSSTSPTSEFANTTIANQPVLPTFANKRRHVTASTFRGPLIAKRYHLTDNRYPSSSSTKPAWTLRRTSCVVTFATVYPLALLINLVLVPRTRTWPVLLRPIVFIGVLVPLKTWVVMPWLTRLLRRWLYPTG